jgi:hypothetical protein
MRMLSTPYSSFATGMTLPPIFPSFPDRLADARQRKQSSQSSGMFSSVFEHQQYGIRSRICQSRAG